jgi:hypothetical protein
LERAAAGARDNWATSLETPTIHRLIDPRDGARRLVLFSGLYPIRSSVSNDDGSDLDAAGADRRATAASSRWRA